MMKFNPEDEIIIQNKVDGNLSEEEEKRFDELIENSSEARIFYKKLIELDLSLKNDSRDIPAIDFSDDIIEKVRPAKSQSQSAKKTILFSSASVKQLISYAAVLLTGLLIGGIGAYVGTTNTKPDARDISGTIINHAENNQEYSKDGTDIKVQQLKSGKWEILTVAVNSQETVQIEISDKSGKITANDVTLQLSDGKFHFDGVANGKLNYASMGNNVFQINLTEITEKINIHFIVDNQVLFEAESE